MTDDGGRAERETAARLRAEAAAVAADPDNAAYIRQLFAANRPATPPPPMPPPAPVLARQTGNPARKFVWGLVAVVLLGGTIASVVAATVTSSASNSTTNGTYLGSASGPQASTHDPTVMNGTLQLSYGATAGGLANYTGGNNSGAPCKGENGYEDIDAGTEVTVSDDTGKIVGLGQLDTGNTLQPDGVLVCVFPFTVTNLPKANFYQVEVSHRGEVSFPTADLADIEVTLGTS